MRWAPDAAEHIGAWMQINIQACHFLHLAKQQPRVVYVTKSCLALERKYAMTATADRYNAPHRLHLETTSYCNFRCEHCYAMSSTDGAHYPIDDLVNVLGRAGAAGVKKITLTGGEIFTHPDWKQIISRSLDVCDNVYFITNGALLDKEKLHWLARERSMRTIKNWFVRGKFKPVEIGIAISLDGLEGHGAVRKNAAGVPVDYRETLDRIRLASRYGLRVTVNTTITNAQSASELSKMYETLSNIKIDRWQIDQAYLFGRYAESALSRGDLSWIDVAKPHFAHIVKDYLKKYPKMPPWRMEIVQVFRHDILHFGFEPLDSLDAHPCSYHFGSLIIEGGKNVMFCPSLRVSPIGDLFSSSTISRIFESDIFQEFSSKSVNDLPCKACRYGKLFHGGCRANALSYNNQMWDCDPVCCSLSPFVEDEIIPLLPKALQRSFIDAMNGSWRPDGKIDLPRPPHA